MSKKHALRTYEVTFSHGETPQTIRIEGSSIAGYALGDGAGSSCLAVYGEDGKTPVLMVAWDAFVLARLASEVEVLKVKRSRKVIDLEAQADDDKEADA
jgi:hypothetical protein